jgi:ATP-dependent helicase/nuclease subunit B
MPEFLRKISDYLFSSFGENMDEICVVLPNRRGGLFLKQHLAAKFSGPAWAPSIFSIEDFVWHLSGLQQTDLAEQLFIFYSVYKKSEGEKAESFEAFCKWAPTLLADFSEADSCLADTEKLFGNLSDIREIENWSLGETTLTDFQKQYLHFWERIGSWYAEYKRTLLAENKGYAGLAYRAITTRITQDDPGLRWKKIVFAGFNALNPAEEKMIATLRESGRAEVLWDADHYYFDNPAQEAGKFLRKQRGKILNRETFAGVPFEHLEDRLSKEEKTIVVTGVARMVSQAKAAAHFLESIGEEKKYSPSTAIVLADELLLLPLLHALPESAAHINITMGFPLRNTPLADLVHIIFRLQENAERFNIHSREGELKFYHQDLIRLLRHPYIRKMFAGTGVTEKAEKAISKFNVVFASPGQLVRYVTDKTDDADAKEKIVTAFAPFLEFLIPWKNTDEALDGLTRAIGLLRPVLTQTDPGKFNLETEYLFQLSLIVKRAHTLHLRWKIATDIKSLRALVTQQLSATTLPFFGEPVAGLQVMGFLETRTLDFENVILLGANENILPGARTQPTFIIYELRKFFGLPVWNDRDAIAAYNFYRLLQRAKNIFLVYNTDTDTFGNKEKSRFITQLLHELPAINPNVKITEAVFDAGIPLAAEPPRPIRIPKDEAVMQLLEQVAEKGLSPSLLNSYRSCGLQFYFHYVAGLREPEEVEETIGADTLGTIIHGALEEIFKPLVGKPLTADALEAAKKIVPHTCDAMFAKHYAAEESSYGKNLLAKRIAVRYLLNYLETEKKNLKLAVSVESLEADLAYTIILPNGKSVKLSGKADRIDRADSFIRLIDYKTGKAEQKELRITEWNQVLEEPGIGKGFQLLMYAWLYSRMKQSSVPVQSGIISFRKLKQGFMKVETPEGETLMPETLDRYEETLVRLVEELFDPQKEFYQTENLESCRICSFNAICRRDE